MTNSIVPSITDAQLADIEQYVTTTQRESSEVCNSQIAAIIARLRAAESEVLRSQQANWQAECIKKGFEYVREPDDHYVVADPAEMVSLLRDLLGIDVRQKNGSDYGVSVTELEKQVDGLVNTIHGLEAFRKDAERYRWLTENHDDKEKREARRALCERLPVMSHSAASSAIDAAMGIKP